MKLMYPTDFIPITTDYSTSHLALDIGWEAGKTNTPPLYACADGVVSKIYDITTGGHTIQINYNNGYQSEFMHCKTGSEVVKVGDKVKQGQVVILMGGTGTECYGNHVHFILRKDGVRVDPKLHCYVYPHQRLSQSTTKNYKLLTYTPIITLGTPIARNSDVKQLEVLVSDLNVRDSANGNKLGYINPGIYNYSETVEANNYTWYNVGFGWIAYNIEWVAVLPKKEPVQEVIEPIKPNTPIEVETPETGTDNEEITVSDEQKTLIGKIIEYIIKLIKTFLKG